MRTPLATTALLATTVAATLVLGPTLGPALGLSAAGAAPAPITRLRPADLPRGADIAIPHLDGRRIVDGDLRIKVEGGVVDLIGTSARAYVVGTRPINGAGGRIVRVARDGSARVLARVADPTSATLSTDGRLVVDARTVITGDLRTVLTARSARSGEVVARHTFPGSVRALDAQVGRAVVGGFGTTGTVSWDLPTDAVTRLAPGSGYRADLTHDLLASYTRDPYQGGCTVVRRISDPAKKLWRSCQERVEGFSPDGRRMVTVDLLSDGIGPSVVGLRNVRGGEVARYGSDYYFGSVQWESAEALLLDTYGREQSAVVRCVVATCERATQLEATPDLRVAAGARRRADLAVSLRARP